MPWHAGSCREIPWYHPPPHYARQHTHIFHYRNVRITGTVPPWKDRFSLTLREAWGGRAMGWNRSQESRLLSLICCEALGSSLDLSGPRFPHQSMGSTNSALWRGKSEMWRKGFGTCEVWARLGFVEASFSPISVNHVMPGPSRPGELELDPARGSRATLHAGSQHQLQQRALDKLDSSQLVQILALSLSY